MARLTVFYIDWNQLGHSALGVWMIIALFHFYGIFILLDSDSMYYMSRRGSAQMQTQASSTPNLIIAGPLLAEEGNMFFDSCRYVQQVNRCSS